MITFIKKIGENQQQGTMPYVEVSSNAAGAALANNNRYYATQAFVEANYPSGEYTLTYLPPSIFEPIEEPIEEPFDKRKWELEVVEPAVRAHIEASIRPKPLDYISIHEPVTYLNHPIHAEEAATVHAWIWDCWESVDEQLEPLLEPIEIETVIANLPTLNEFNK